MPGKGKNGKNGKSDELEQQKLLEQLEKRKKFWAEKEAEHEKKWKDCWDKKIQKEERLEDCKQCCDPDEFFRHPKTQSNIWIQINHEKNAQHVQMYFKNVPVPKPDPPPLPRLTMCDVVNEKEKVDSKPAKKKKNTGKKKK